MINWGILGAGNIAERFADSLSHIEDARLLSVSCRTRKKAEEFAKRHQALRSYDDYDQLLEDQEVDAVYLSLPHGLHLEWAIKALKAGKAVLCEKPAGLSADEVKKMAEAARDNDVLFMEAMKTRFEPAYEKIRSFVDSGGIGELLRVETSLCNKMPFEELKLMGKTYHTQAGQGGALLDGGIYCAGWLEEYLKQDIERSSLTAALKDGIDYYVCSELKSGKMSGSLETAFDREKERRAVLYGTEGTIIIQELHRPQKAEIYKDGKLSKLICEPYDFDDFHGEIVHFNDCLRSGLKESPVMPLAASIRCAEILDVIRQGFRYEQSDLEVLEKQEEVLRFESFQSADALKLGNEIIRVASDYDRQIAVRIVREEDQAVIFQYLMDTKDERNISYMQGKMASARECGHSSLWAYVDHQLNGHWEQMFQKIPEYMPCAGAFPIRVRGDLKAMLMVSGLHEGNDHELIIKALENVLNRKAPIFSKMAV